MRVQAIVVMSLIAALAAGGVALRWLANGPSATMVPDPLRPAGHLAVVALSAYALVALAATTATLLGDMKVLARRLAGIAELTAPTQRDLVEAFGTSRLRSIAIQAAAALGENAVSGPNVIRPAEIRSEIIRLDCIWLARTQFFTALALLTAIALLGAVQQYLSLVPLPTDIPTAASLLALGSLILLAGLGRLAIDGAAEPVVEAISRIPGEQPETRLLRRVTEFLDEIVGRTSRRFAMAPRPVTGKQLDQLAKAIEHSRRAWMEAVAGFSTAADELRATLVSSAEVIENTVQAAAARLSTTPSGDAAAARLVELQDAVERLTAAIERLGALPDERMGATGLNDATRSSSRGNVQLAFELATLLREIETKP